MGPNKKLIKGLPLKSVHASYDRSFLLYGVLIRLPAIRDGIAQYDDYEEGSADVVK